MAKRNFATDGQALHGGLRALSKLRQRAPDAGVEALSNAVYDGLRGPDDMASRTIRRRFGSWTEFQRQLADAEQVGDAHLLDWPEDEGTAPSIELPVMPEPPEWAVYETSTRVDGEGQVLTQTVRAHPKGEHDHAQIYDPREGLYASGTTTQIGPAGRIRQQWIKSSKDSSTARILDRLTQRVHELVTPRETRIEAPLLAHDAADYLAVYPIGDMHIGMAAVARKTGDVSWGLKQGEAILREAITKLTRDGNRIQRAREAMIIDVGDFLHVDNPSNRTPKGQHTLDADGDFEEIAATGIRLWRYLIDTALESHDLVSVVIARGNHNPLSAMWLRLVLRITYEQEPRVLVVEESPEGFHYYRFGQCLIGVTHGDRTKKDALESIMSHDRPRAWGETKHRYWYTGHLHHTVKKEYRGATVEVFRTLAPKDAWHAASGYRSGRDMNRILLHRERGEALRTTINADELQAQILERAQR